MCIIKNNIDVTYFQDGPQLSILYEDFLHVGTN